MTEAKHKQRLFELAFGHMATQTVATAVRLGVADTLGDGERTGTELAAALDTDAAATTQLCSALAALGILTQAVSGEFRLTEVGALLRTDRADSLHSFTRTFTDPAVQGAWRELDTAVRTGSATFNTVFGKSFFEYVAGDPELSTHFPAALRQSALQTAEALPHHYDFAAFDTVADIGGGSGAVLAAILAAHPGLRGILYDTVAAVDTSEATLTAAGVADRCTVMSGDIGTEIPAGADLYLIKNVVHYADDDRAVTVLGNIRRVIPPHGRLLIVDPVMPNTVDGSLPDTMYLSDLHMRLIGAGQGRTKAEFESLCARAGFPVTEFALLPAPMAFSLIEALPGDSDH
ncbi:methyltransferase [Streptomyces coffeae]|uniref:Methyltransferase domain-containing protein n=1 Tax=Streptomyces coffeae TaxID=621382 RepID=A0ABS1N7L7_9ACTN|nr:methyltransferase [Streptomyces coffeae]MBL1095977.1 methyltransferase domain-containing protein [Streptomyces coffeae]